MTQPIFRKRLSDQDDYPPDWTEWETVAFEHPGFGPAFEALVRQGCDKWVLFDTLDLINRPGFESTSSPDTLRRIRTDLQQGREALLDLFHGNPFDDRAILEERVLLRYSGDDVVAAQRVLGDLSDQLRKLQRGADRRRSRVQDQFRALLVRYVKRQTGKLHDRLVCELLNGALAPLANWGAHDYDKDGNLLPEPVSYRLPDDPYKSLSPEAHRRWRGRNRKLIDEPPPLEKQWEQDLKRSAEQRNDPKPQKLRAVQ